MRNLGRRQGLKYITGLPVGAPENCFARICWTKLLQKVKNMSHLSRKIAAI